MTLTTQVRTEMHPAVVDLNDLVIALQREFKPRSDQSRKAVKNAIRTLAHQALRHTPLICDDAVKTIQSIIASIDEKLSQQVNEILHHPDFQDLESAWRGLHHLALNTETDETLKIRVLSISKKEISRTLRKFKGIAWDQSPLFKKIYEEEYGQVGGEPYGCLIGDYYFDHSPHDIDMLAGIAQIAAASHSPFISAASPHLMQMDSWRELANPRDISKIFLTPEHSGWRAFRESEDSRYVALTLPRMLGRLPYGARINPVDEFSFEEDTDGSDSSKYLWTNASYAMGVNITRSFKLYGWLSRIRGFESGGLVEDLPVHTFPSDDGGIDLKCPTEIAISDRRESELSKNGLLPLLHRKNTQLGVFVGAQTVNKPIRYEDPDASANAELSARLPYIFATCRFAHYLKCMVRDKIGAFKERSEVEEWLNQWIQGFVHPSPELGSEESKAQQPLSSAEVKVVETEDNPGYYTAIFYLRPHYQLEGLTISLRLVSRLPSARSG
ncbi:type VI secretion system contractile sheath large subunit [Rhizobium sp. NLR9b]|uniref:type VI secretion system contractile sheath large subunit n=1 Tax=unclassified Rhizobium TaxID=2613769 RepID=UPI001C82BC5E|nr:MULTISPECIES: type VI secretion system contractile sheath large subunit [unclassified Rhizobium]MBX5230606.1 type VI secretion system contractile sheath large subunit [Rhizobium sp. NLR9b]MBX5291274.1 type VI secretion system contractile sheath large subunit [Rhizobium sp. NLR10b]